VVSLFPPSPLVPVSSFPARSFLASPPCPSLYCNSLFPSTVSLASAVHSGGPFPSFKDGFSRRQRTPPNPPSSRSLFFLKVPAPSPPMPPYSFTTPLPEVFFCRHPSSLKDFHPNLPFPLFLSYCHIPPSKTTQTYYLFLALVPYFFLKGRRNHLCSLTPYSFTTPPLHWF